MRNTSLAFRQSTYRPETGEVYVLLLTIEHSTLETPIRLSTDNADTMPDDVFEAYSRDDLWVGTETITGNMIRGTISNDLFYIYMPMQITLPEDSDELITQARIEIDNINQGIMIAVREMTTPPTISMQVVMASTPNVVEFSGTGMILLGVDADPMTISGTLSKRHFFGEPFPGGSMLPSNFAGLY